MTRDWSFFGAASCIPGLLESAEQMPLQYKAAIHDLAARGYLSDEGVTYALESDFSMKLNIWGKALQEHLKGFADRLFAAGNATKRADERANRTIQRFLDGVQIPTDLSINPHGYYVYFLWGSAQDVPLYVGQSINLMSRLGTHMSTRGRAHRIRRITFLRCASKHIMDSTERRYIAKYQPELNVQGVAS